MGVFEELRNTKDTNLIYQKAKERGKDYIRNLKDVRGNTILHFAIENGYHE